MTDNDFEVHESGTFKKMEALDIRLQAMRHNVHQIIELATTIQQQPPSQRHQSAQKIAVKARTVLALITQQIDARPD